MFDDGTVKTIDDGTLDGTLLESKIATDGDEAETMYWLLGNDDTNDN
jgi:hypothetical protein